MILHCEAICVSVRRLEQKVLRRVEVRVNWWATYVTFNQET